MLMPKKVKYRKQQRGRRRGVALCARADTGLKAMEAAWITDRQIEASRVAMTRSIKRGGKVWIRVFPDKPITKKPRKPAWAKARARQRAGWRWCGPGSIMFEMKGVPASEAKRAFQLAGAKLPIKTRFATRFAEEKVQ